MEHVQEKKGFGKNGVFRNIPYGRQNIDQADVDAVVETLYSDWLTTGPVVERFEKKISAFTHARYGVAVNSGTAALHAAMNALEIKPGDEVIVPPITFAATANAVVYQGGTPVFADVDPDTLLIDPESVKKVLSPKTRAVITVDYAGQPCDYDSLRTITKDRGIHLVADACHSLGAEYKGRQVGSLADLNVFSFHPVKNMTTGEGGMITTDNPGFAEKMRSFRNHGVNIDSHGREKEGSWYYEIKELGFNYRLTDFQCALGLSQLSKLNAWIEQRNDLAKEYDRNFEQNSLVEPLVKKTDILHAYHLYVIRIDFSRLSLSRKEIFLRLREKGIGVNVHYIPVYYHPFYRKKFGLKKGLCPGAEDVYEQILTLPLFPGLGMNETDRICEIISKMLKTDSID